LALLPYQAAEKTTYAVIAASSSRFNNLLSLTGKRQDSLVGHRDQFRVLPTGYLAYSHHQQPPWHKAFSQVIEDLATAPATKIDEQVLAKNNVHSSHWSLGQLQHI
jgi:hypothetical protein